MENLLCLPKTKKKAIKEAQTNARQKIPELMKSYKELSNKFDKAYEDFYKTGNDKNLDDAENAYYDAIDKLYSSLGDNANGLKWASRGWSSENGLTSTFTQTLTADGEEWIESWFASIDDSGKVRVYKAR